MLLPHVTTADLLRHHNNLQRIVFDGYVWKKGTDGVIASTTIPCTFTSATGDFLTGELEEDSFDTTDKRIVLNIPERGIYDITGIDTDTTITMAAVPALQPVVNVNTDQAYNYATVAVGTSLAWSIGGWEEKILAAYIDILTRLRIRKIDPGAISNNDPAYNPAIIFKALELIFTSQIESDGDLYTVLANRYYYKYEEQLKIIIPETSGYTTVACKEWERTS